MLRSLAPLSTGLAACLLISSTASAQLIRPTSATTGSQFSLSYSIDNAINGTGLPSGFTSASLHQPYTSVSNHWTTGNDAIASGLAFAEFFFSSPQDLGQLHLWNHQSDGPAASGFYAVTQFDLTFRDAAGTTLAEVLDVVATGGVGDGTSQSFSFSEVTGVSSVLFEIDFNSQPAGGTTGFTGLAEIAFGPSIEIGTNYCAPVPNSTGQTGHLTATGSAFVAQNDVTLRAERMPPGVFGVFIVSRDQGSVPMGSGTLCLSGTLGRFQQQVFQVGASGAAEIGVDLTAIPQAGSTAAAVAGETWSFQAWHRDSAAGAPTSNFTDGLELTLL